MTDTNRIEFAQRQFEIAKMYAMYWHAMAVTGAATLRKTQQGREPTDEEKSQGLVIGWRDHTDAEKIQNALETMARHIQAMADINDRIHALNDSDSSRA